MYGISSKGKEAIGEIVENLFDSIALQFIGDIPKLRKKKTLVISSERNMGLAHLFIQSMGNKAPNEMESDVLKSLLNSAYSYIEGLKNRTMANITERMDGLTREAQLRKEKVKEEDIRAAIDEEMKKSKSQMQAIAESESTKLRNLGTMMEITRAASSIGDDDPTVLFVVFKDEATCKECIRLHLMEDEVTPRLWKFSELRQAYHKRGGDRPSSFGLHPHCRCTLTYLPQGFGFDKTGNVTYKSEGYDAYSKQRV